MTGNGVKQKLADGGTALGALMFEFSTTGATRLCAAAGAEFVLYDLEHTGWSIETIRSLTAAARASDVVPCVRVPDTEYHLIARPLDIGIQGLMVPNVKTAEQARKIVEFSKYPPRGNRGVGILYSDLFEADGLAATMDRINREQWIIAQIESVEGLENADQIAAVDGIDVLWIGHTDLTTSMGIPGQFDHPDFQSAVDRLLSVCEAQGIPLAIMITDVEQGKAFLERGFRCLGFGDIWLFEQALRNGLTALREHL